MVPNSRACAFDSLDLESLQFLLLLAFAWAMFCEPTYHSSFTRHPANSWSNLPYAVVGLFMLFHAPYTQWQLCNTLFGAMVFSLSVVSFVWHSTNCPNSQYVDLAVMDSVILYFPVRHSVMCFHQLAFTDQTCQALYSVYTHTITSDQVSHLFPWLEGHHME